MTKKMQVKDGLGQLQDVHTAPGYDEADDSVKIKSMQKRVRDAFPGSVVNPLKWDTSLGAGGTASVASGVLTLGSGTTANSETILTSKETFTIPFRVSVGLLMSQRIANQSFYLEAVSVNPVTGIPDGQNSMSWLMDGTNPALGKYVVQAEGMAELISATSTIPSTSTVSMLELEAFADEAWFHTGVFDGVAGRTQSYRRHQRTPDPNAVYKMRLRWKNGSSAPASNTNVAVSSFAVEDYAEILAEVVAGRGNSSAGQSLGVTVTNNLTIGGTVRLAPSAGFDGYGTVGKLNSAATTNATLVRNAPCNIGFMTAHNLSASVKFLKLYNKVTAPTVGTDTPVIVIPIPPNSHVALPIPAAGMRMSVGLGLAITGGVADTDTTAVALNDVIVNWGYI